MATRTTRARDGFDFTFHIRALTVDIIDSVAELQHIDVSRVAISFSQARKRVLYGLQASLTPLRFEGGARQGIYRGQEMSVQQVCGPDGREMLYILTFYLPRFLDLHFREKLMTMFHELWHISPKFDGDLRRHSGRCYAHTGSQEAFEAQLDPLVDGFLARRPADALPDFLHMNFTQLQRAHGKVYGLRIPRPKLIPVQLHEPRRRVS